MSDAAPGAPQPIAELEQLTGVGMILGIARAARQVRAAQIEAARHGLARALSAQQSAQERVEEARAILACLEAAAGDTIDSKREPQSEL